MPDSHRAHLVFEKESIVTQHGIFALLVRTLNNQIQVKYQSIEPSPYDTHDGIMSSFLVALFAYATASVAEVILRTRESIYSTVVGNLRLFASALATIFLLVILAPISGCVVSVIWAILFVKVAYESSKDLHNTLGQSFDKVRDKWNRVIESVRSRREEPNQQHDQAAAA